MSSVARLVIGAASFVIFSVLSHLLKSDKRESEQAMVNVLIKYLIHLDFLKLLAMLFTWKTPTLCCVIL